MDPTVSRGFLLVMMGSKQDIFCKGGGRDICTGNGKTGSVREKQFFKYLLCQIDSHTEIFRVALTTGPQLLDDGKDQRDVRGVGRASECGSIASRIPSPVLDVKELADPIIIPNPDSSFLIRPMTHVGRWGLWFGSTLVYRSYQSVMSSDHLLDGLSRGRPASTVPNITVFSSRWSSSCRCVRTASTSCASSGPLHCGALSYCFCADTSVGNSVFPTQIQYSHVAPHLKCHEFSEVCCIYSPCFSSVKKTGTSTLILMLRSLK